MIDKHHGWNASFKPIVLGFFLSCILAFAMYRVVVGHHLRGYYFTLAVFGLAIFQSVIQLILFMQVGLEGKPRWVSLALIFTILVILIVVGGSVWIMNNLNYNLMNMPMPTHGSF
jgi:cytochrome o ubiquinol oxidase operon protein cyoD